MTNGYMLAQEGFRDVFPEARPMLEEHWAEIATFPERGFHPNEDGYLQAESNGQLRIYTVRTSDGTLAGYCCLTVCGSLHDIDCLQANEVAFYVRPAHRGRGLSLRLVHFSEEKLLAEGVEVIYRHVKTRHPQLGQILKRAGYGLDEHIFMRRLD